MNDTATLVYIIVAMGIIMSITSCLLCYKHTRNKELKKKRKIQLIVLGVGLTLLFMIILLGSIVWDMPIKDSLKDIALSVTFLVLLFLCAYFIVPHTHKKKNK